MMKWFPNASSMQRRRRHSSKWIWPRLQTIATVGPSSSECQTFRSVDKPFCFFLVLILSFAMTLQATRHKPHRTISNIQWNFVFSFVFFPVRLLLANKLVRFRRSTFKQFGWIQQNGLFPSSSTSANEAQKQIFAFAKASHFHTHNFQPD